MSKKCGGNNKCSCERESSSSPKPSRSTSKRKRTRCHRKTSRRRESSSRSSEKSKRSRKKRTEHSVEFEDVETNEDSQSKSKRCRKSQRKGIKKEKKINKKRKKKKIDKIEKTSSQPSSSRSSAFSRLVQHLIKSCFCLESNFDPISSSTRYACCCCHCTCRFCRTDYDSKSIQCDDSDRPVHDDANLPKEENVTNRRTKKSPKSLARHKSAVDWQKSKTSRRSDFRSGDRNKTQSSCNCKRKNKSDTGMESSIRKNSSGLKDVKCRKSAKSLVDSERILSDRSRCSKDCCPSQKTSRRISSSRKKISLEQCQKTCQTEGGKSTKALLVMFDILLWPRMCFPKRHQ